MGEREPICAACGRPVSVCTADPEGCAPAISKEALDEANRLYDRVADAHYSGDGRTDARDAIAAALQRHMDRADVAEGARKGAQIANTMLRQQVHEAVQRAEAAEARVKELEAECQRKLAELHAEIKDWAPISGGGDRWDELRAILAKYEDKP